MPQEFVRLHAAGAMKVADAAEGETGHFWCLGSQWPPLHGEKWFLGGVAQGRSGAHVRPRVGAAALSPPTGASHRPSAERLRAGYSALGRGSSWSSVRRTRLPPPNPGRHRKRHRKLGGGWSTAHVAGERVQLYAAERGCAAQAGQVRGGQL